MAESVYLGERWQVGRRRASIDWWPGLPTTYTHTHIDSPPLPLFQPSPIFQPMFLPPLFSSERPSFLYFSFEPAAARVFFDTSRIGIPSRGTFFSNEYLASLFFLFEKKVLFCPSLVHARDDVDDFSRSFVIRGEFRRWSDWSSISGTFLLLSLVSSLSFSPLPPPSAGLIVSPLCNLFRLPSFFRKILQIVFVFAALRDPSFRREFVKFDQAFVFYITFVRDPHSFCITILFSR